LPLLARLGKDTYKYPCRSPESSKSFVRFNSTPKGCQIFTPPSFHRRRL
jgi:hypothetical protein